MSRRITYKKCTMCSEIKNITEFYKNKNGRYGVQAKCKPCYKQRNKEIYEKYREKYLNKVKEYYNNNKESCIQRIKLRYLNDVVHREKVKKYVREYNKQKRNTPSPSC